MIEQLVTWEQLKELKQNFNLPFKVLIDKDGNYRASVIESGLYYHSDLTINQYNELITNYPVNQPNDKKDPYTGKVVTKDEPYNGALYIPCLRFTTGQTVNFNNGGDTNWSIDISIPGKTVIKYSPNFSYQIDGCGFKICQAKSINELVFNRVSVAEGTPFEHIFVRNWGIDKDYEFYERITAPKFMKYYSSFEGVPDNLAQSLNDITFDISHDPSENIKTQIWINIYMV